MHGLDTRRATVLGGQLVAIASAARKRCKRVPRCRCGWLARGTLAIWRFEVREREAVAADGGEATLWRLVREPAHPCDMRVEMWLDPARGDWPARLRQTQVPGGEPLQWTSSDEVHSEHGG
jgi:hypothetical protein